MKKIKEKNKAGYFWNFVNLNTDRAIKQAESVSLGFTKIVNTQTVVNGS